ncbi:glucose 1-dehydrogenase [Halalkalibaculum sp. DA3122]|uniref:glucose 1-dehydrogenase n=1 Tax=Halalkalibaculum sp. DA3122 TaxID=3373607 RepID=UPI00375473E0
MTRILKNKVAIVTGAATGIGRATAVALAKEGANILVADINQQELAKTLALIEQEDVDGVSMKTDIARPDQVDNMVRQALKTFGRLDIACNNAGIGGAMKSTAEYTEEEWDQVINVNLKGQWLCMKYEIPAMLETGEGSIINISSILGKVGFARAAAYTASKHGLIGLTKTAALEYAEDQIRINAICPAFIDTPMLEQAGITTDEETKEATIALHPVGRLGTPEEIAEAVVWLASSRSSFVTGHALMVDGGYTAR